MRHALLIALLTLVLMGPARAADGPTVRFDTSLGDIDVRLFSDDAPNTVATFLRYVASGAYDSSYFHRSVRDFIIQGGGYRWVDGQSAPINELIADPDPFKRSNQRGTLAVARRPGRPNVSTSQWFFNQADNASLDASSDNYTVFGRVNDRASLAVMDAIGALQIIDGSGGQSGSAFGELPVVDYAGGQITADNLVLVRSIKVVPDSRLPYALPFKLKRSMVAVKRRKNRLRITVKRLPAGTNVVARLRGRRAVASAPRGTARLVLARPGGKRKRKLKITATPPGIKASSVVLKVA
jgi:cyclophilin family peptidyl-prolyl cis-trans isomerase